MSKLTDLPIFKAPSPGEVVNAPPKAEPPRPGMIWITGGTFRMGSDRHYAEEAPVHRVTVDGFWIDATSVTNREFRKFVNATGYVTYAQIAPDPRDYPGALPEMLRAGSLVFAPPEHPVDLRDSSQWWGFKFGADWRHPYGPHSSISGLKGHAHRQRRCDAPGVLPRRQREIQRHRLLLEAGRLAVPAPKGVTVRGPMKPCLRSRFAARPEVTDKANVLVGAEGFEPPTPCSQSRNLKAV